MDAEDIELELFVQALKLRHGYDFGQYARASLKRRVNDLVKNAELGTIGALTSRVVHDEAFLPQVIAGISVPVSEMFRNPEIFKALSAEVFPVLASYPHINIWQAGCARGEEVYSLAILLEEAGLYDRTQIYATDFNDHVLHVAQEGIFSVHEARLYAQNYLAAGGKHTLSHYWHARYERVKLDERLKRNITFANHNLVADGVFCEAHLILCRNVLIYFTNTLQDQVLGLFRDSLVRGGFLALGNKESIHFSANAREFLAFNSAARIFRLGPSVGK
ncbi:MAG: protein-glutamate O-methyltransferase CheR [Nevskia sp.]|nr:protein-glutamate O-methyltransferase CheR [Nevskia sp.]MCK9384697.1 protein-glutamate O-methyltransferase CheR [Nevskia sp.]